MIFEFDFNRSASNPQHPNEILVRDPVVQDSETEGGHQVQAPCSETPAGEEVPAFSPNVGSSSPVTTISSPRVKKSDPVATNPCKLHVSQHFFNLHTNTVRSSSSPVHLTCQVCFKTFQSTSTKSKHMKSHNPQEVCGICGLRYARKDNLARHIRIMHHVQ
jgi:hypothetical protein